jgi:hypothetical protein
MKSVIKSILLAITILSVLSLISSRRRSKHRSLARNPNLFKLNTSWASANDGKVTALAAHEVKCGQNTALTSFGLKRSDENLRYEHSCLAHPALKQTSLQQKTTEWGPFNGDGGATNYLDRHDVQCPSGFLIQSFKLVVNRDQMRYEYVCIQAETLHCYDNYTNFTEGGKSFANYYLDRQFVQVGDSDRMGIQTFKLMTEYKAWSMFSSFNVEYKYRFKVCSLKPMPTPALNSNGSSASSSSSATNPSPQVDQSKVSDYIERNENSKRRYKK